MKFVIEIPEEVLKTRRYDDFFGCGSTTLTAVLDKGKSFDGVLDKIRAEITDWQTDIHDNEYDAETHDFVFERIYEIIDEYKAESEE